MSVDGAGLVVPLTVEEAQVLADDAARRVLMQLKSAGVRGRVRVEFELSIDGGVMRDRGRAVRELPRGEPGSATGAARAPAAVTLAVQRVGHRSGGGGGHGRRGRCGRRIGRRKFPL